MLAALLVASSVWGWPLAGPPEVVRPFDRDVGRYAAGHRGVDLEAAVGTPVVAAGAGRVTYAGRLAGRGVVVVQHGELRTTYEPVEPAVRVGADVALGERLGVVSVGHASCPSGPCLHWGLRRGETYLDPLLLVRRGPSRLLPVEPVTAAPPAAAVVRAPRPPSAAARPSVPPPDEPALSLVRREAPSAAVAVLALLAGLSLLVRRTGAPPPPAGGTAAAAFPPPPPRDEEPVRAAAVTDLDAERLRRRHAG